MNDEQLKEQLENLKKGEYIYLSNWYGGKNKSGYNGYLVNFVDNSIYEFESIGTYTNTLTTEATLNKITTFPVELKTIFALYIKNEKLFYFDNIDKLVFDMGTSIEVSLGNVKSKIMNADKTCSNGRICVYDDLKTIIEEIIDSQTKSVEVSPSNDEKEEDEESVFTTFRDLDFNELLVLRNNKIQQCFDKINGVNLNDFEKQNQGYLFFNTKMIIENIKLIDSKIINKFSNNLNEETKILITNELQMLEEKEKTYVNINDVLEVLNKIVKFNN